MRDAGSGLVITYNGEVYNFRELRREIGGHPFSSDCDTEVVLRAWRRWGPGSVGRLRGMFAFGIWDPRRRILYLVRDRVGIKPLYYTVGIQGLAFSSELGALLESGLVSRDVDRTALAGYLRYGYVPGPLCIYRGVRQLRPGHVLRVEFDTGHIRECLYWRPISATEGIDEREAVEELDSLVTEVIRQHIRSDVPFGAFLSGGVDSSLVVAFMARELGEPVRSYTVDFPDPAYSEARYAERVSVHVGTRQRTELLTPELSIDLWARIIRRFAEPFADSSALPTFLVSQLASTEVKMVLSGDGGDELFGGYDSYSSVYDALRPSFPGGWIRSLRRRLVHGLRGRSAHLLESWQIRHHAARDIFDVFDRAAVLGWSQPEMSSDEFIETPPEADPVLRCQMRDLSGYLPGDILTKVDRMSMEHSLEVRVPLLDHRLIEFALRLPLDLRLRRGTRVSSVTSKYLLKGLAARHLPRDLLHRRKMGFGIPVTRWLHGPLSPFVRDLLVDERADMDGQLDPRPVRDIVRGFYAGEPVSAAKLWVLASLRLWLDEIHGADSRLGTVSAMEHG